MSIESKEVMNLKFAKNLIMMEKRQRSWKEQFEGDEEEMYDSEMTSVDSRSEGSRSRSDKDVGDALSNPDDSIKMKSISDSDSVQVFRRAGHVHSPTCDDNLKAKKNNELTTTTTSTTTKQGEELSKMTPANLEAMQAKFRRDSMQSLTRGDHSLCSTEDGEEDVTVWSQVCKDFWKLITYIEKFENINRFLAIVIFYVFGVVFYSFYEEWTVLDTIYFITISITTVGFGDLVPTNDISKIFTMFYNLLGLVVIFSYVNHFAENMLQYAERQTEKLAERRSRKKKMRQGKETESDGDEEDNAIDGIPYSKYRRKACLYLALIIAVIFVGSVFYMYNEDWTFVNAIYFSFIATMTIGYGDPTLHKSSSRVFSIFYVLFSVVIIAMALGNIGAIKLTIRQEKKKFNMLQKKLDLESIIAMDDDGDGVDRIEFLTAMLIQMNGLSKEDDIDPWLKRFDELDKDGSGKLDEEDLRLFAMEEEIRKQCRREVRQRLEEKQQVSNMMRNLLKNPSISSIKGWMPDDSEYEDDVDSDNNDEAVKKENAGVEDVCLEVQNTPSLEESPV